MHVNPTYMLMKPKKSMWGDFCFVVKISQKFHNIFYFNMIWKNTVKTKYGFGFYRSYCYRNRKYNLLLSGCSDLQQNLFCK